MSPREMNHPYEYDVALVDRVPTILRRGGYCFTPVWAPFLSMPHALIPSTGIEECRRIVEALKWAEIVRTDEPNGHTVVIDEDGFSVEHPLVERLNGSLFECTLHHLLAHDARVAPVGQRIKPPGKYRVRLFGEEWVWEEL